MKDRPIFDAKNYQEILSIATENRDVFFERGAIGMRTVYDIMENAPKKIKKEFETQFETLVHYPLARMNGSSHQRADELSGLASRIQAG